VQLVKNIDFKITDNYYTYIKRDKDTSWRS
jgi:hypothetical protein